jgi:hypothetical protein
MFPSLRGEMDWWKYRSRSPLSFPKKYARIMGGMEEERQAIQSQQWRGEKTKSCSAQGVRRGIYTPFQK